MRTCYSEYLVPATPSTTYAYLLLVNQVRVYIILSKKKREIHGREHGVKIQKRRSGATAVVSGDIMSNSE